MAKKFHRDVWVGTVLLILCIAVFFTAVQIPGQASYLPITLSLLMGLCSVFIILKGLRLTKEQDGDFHYSMTIKSSKYAFLFMFFIFIYFLGFRYHILDRDTDLYAAFHEIFKAEVLESKHCDHRSLHPNLLCCFRYHSSSPDL